MTTLQKSLRYSEDKEDDVMSTTVKEAVRTAKALNEFISVIKDAGITIEELSELSMLKPDFSETLTKIKEWVVVPTTDETPNQATKRSYILMSKKTQRDVAKYVANNFDGVAVDMAIVSAKNKFGSIPSKTIRRLVIKETFVSLTDEYYSIIDGVIHKKK